MPAAERVFDVLFSFIFIVVCTPLLCVALLLAAIGVGFPPVYISRRVGRYGVPFRHVKIRTMRAGRALGRAYFEEARVTRLGRLLRRYHVDELPELFLILNGTLSLVGPRPLPARFLTEFDCRTRERARPGWTGLAQIKLLRRGILLGPEQIRLDNIYAARKSLGYNLRILAATCRAFRRRRPPVADLRYNEYRRNFL